MQKYEVLIQDKRSVLDIPLRYSYVFDAENFAHAEAQALNAITHDDEIIKIEKDYEN